MTVRKIEKKKLAEPQNCTCNGRRHYFHPERRVWVPCICLRKERAEERYQRANIPVRYKDAVWKEFFATYAVSRGARVLVAAQELKDPRHTKPGVFFTVVGNPGKAKDTLGALLARASCDGGRPTIITDLANLVDHAFKREEADAPNPHIQETMILNLGHEPAHKWNRHVLEKAVCERWLRNLSTIVLVHGDEQRVSCGSTQVEHALKSFEKINISPKAKK